MSGNCSLKILTWVPSLIDKDYYSQPQETWEPKKWRNSHRSCCRSFGQNSRNRIPILLGCPRRLLPKILRKKKSYDRFFSDQVYRDSQLKIGWTEQKCIEMDKLAQQDHTYRLCKEEFKKISKTVVSHTEQIGQECTDATSIRLSSCVLTQKPSPSWIRRRSCRTNYLHSNIRRWHSSSSDSWWDWDTSKSWWSSW